MTTKSTASAYASFKNRRSEYDVTDEICVADGEIAISEIIRIFKEIYPKHTKLTDLIARHGDIITRMYTGHHKDYRPCDSLYHDLQHTMDVSLCTTRMLYGYETKHIGGEGEFGPEVFALGILVALYHDSGYILSHNQDADIPSCASVTQTHVTRGERLMYENLSSVNAFADVLSDLTKIIHYTGCEISFKDIKLERPFFHRVGKILGSSDLIAQVADRCYLEKCRDRLYPEFVMGGMDYSEGGVIHYASATDLLHKSLGFYRDFIRPRLELHYQSYYHYVGISIDGYNHYAWWMETNMRYLQMMLKHDNLSKLRRELPKTYGEDRFPYQAMQEIARSRSKLKST